jgi:hypothetical protein
MWYADNIGHNDNYFMGTIDDVRFYDRCVLHSAISLQNVQTAYCCLRPLRSNLNVMPLIFFVRNRALTQAEALALHHTVGNANNYQQGSPTQNTIADYQFNGNAADTSGVNHGTVSGAVQYVADRNGAQNAAAYFNGRDAFITVQAPFPNADTAFTIAVWLKPTLIDAGWHGFVGYHSDLGDTMECCCPHRSPSMWVARAVEDGSALHYDSCEKTGRGQVGACLDHLAHTFYFRKEFDDDPAACPRSCGRLDLRLPGCQPSGAASHGICTG